MYPAEINPRFLTPVLIVAMLQGLLPWWVISSGDAGDATTTDICTDTIPCPALFVDLDGDGKPEALAFLPAGRGRTKID